MSINDYLYMSKGGNIVINLDTLGYEYVPRKQSIFNWDTCMSVSREHCLQLGHFMSVSREQCLQLGHLYECKQGTVSSIGTLYECK